MQRFNIPQWFKPPVDGANKNHTRNKRSKVQICFQRNDYATAVRSSAHQQQITTHHLQETDGWDLPWKNVPHIQSCVGIIINNIFRRLTGPTKTVLKMIFKLLTLNKTKQNNRIIACHKQKCKFFCALLHAQIIMAKINLAVQQHAYLTATPTGHMIFNCISPLAIYTKNSGPAAPSLITPYTPDAYQPCMSWDRERWKKTCRHLLRTLQEHGTVQVQRTVRTVTRPEKTSLIIATRWPLTFQSMIIITFTWNGLQDKVAPPPPKINHQGGKCRGDQCSSWRNWLFRHFTS